MARQKLGQHFLTDAGWREKIARAIGISEHALGGARGADENSCWIEIGAGHGEMTRALTATGAQVYSIELDAALVRRLQDVATELPNLAVLPGDVLDADFAAIAAGRRVRIYGNLPYYITSPILHRLFQFADAIDEIHIVIQLEVAFRLAARPGTRDYGYLSVLTQYFTRPNIALKIPRGAFRPPPEVGSALVSLRLPGERAKHRVKDEAQFLEFVKGCFAQKRKTLANNLKAMAKPEEIRGALAEAGVKAEARAEELAVETFVKLFALLGG
ncbi:MAG TPA: 16S rRNA (adenine(1518)-N(6)/adenine(1519)-N(6))-dimethyltransferase RsmA [Candidatus Acidoferrales bacterium]|nr:16S rRNA (adenine(1518)-N(6)/adenine(1519)-N(6))-dimethyltransferase RsmA [Candidatus Acidoferrales bacterium]